MASMPLTSPIPSLRSFVGDAARSVARLTRVGPLSVLGKEKEKGRRARTARTRPPSLVLRNEVMICMIPKTVSFLGRMGRNAKVWALSNLRFASELFASWRTNCLENATLVSCLDRMAHRVWIPLNLNFAKELFASWTTRFLGRTLMALEREPFRQRSGKPGEQADKPQVQTLGRINPPLPLPRDGSCIKLRAIVIASVLVIMIIVRLTSVLMT
jgi:hypothetical protein